MFIEWCRLIVFVPAATVPVQYSSKRFTGVSPYKIYGTRYCINTCFVECVLLLLSKLKNKTKPNRSKSVLLFIFLCEIFTPLFPRFYNTQFSPNWQNIAEVRRIYVFNYSPLFTRITSMPIDREITVKITLLSPIALVILQHQLALLKNIFHLLKGGVKHWSWKWVRLHLRLFFWTGEITSL